MDTKVFRSFLKKTDYRNKLKDQLVLLLNGRILQYNTYRLYKSMDCIDALYNSNISEKFYKYVAVDIKNKEILALEVTDEKVH